ncbi:OmpA family protein [Photobacterium damselae]|uniref:OmpA family protein n=1 Tax=Photobacterium damselae TaxID=38293 RepID=UPI0014852B9C|nr:OmpA family protein [Photobacterium damselae]ELI6450069.1 OmpA family protein [Photobacterium damselae]MCG9706174.1 OmpA family protein [Photobacterium damselae]BDR33649.1 membrane protein [Photobacterium damselae subsp. damselae]
MKKSLMILPLALLVSAAANAATENPFYAGARLGNAFYDSVGNGIDVDNTNLAGGVFAGYQFTPWFALEGGYTNLGSASVTNGIGKFTAQGADIVGKYSYAINDKLDVFGKLGTFYYDWHAKDGAKGTDHGWAATAGVGAEYFLTKNISTAVEYQYYNDVGGADIHFAGVSLAYHWGAPAPVVAEPVYVDQVSVETLEELKLAVPFAFDSSALSAGDRAKLAPFEQRLQAQDAAQIYVVGYTDSKGSEAYNQKLSVKRADAVAEALRSVMNVDGSRIIAEGRGESNPVASNATAEGRAQNRRVEIISPSIDVETVTQVLAN